VDLVFPLFCLILPTCPNVFSHLLQAQVNVKIKQAFCPPKIVEGNPCLEYIKYIVFPWFGRFEVARKESNGGNK
jgi:hypothetical protein